MTQTHHTRLCRSVIASNTKFVISAVDHITQQQPDWLSIDQRSQSITINTDSISSVMTASLVLSARLFTISDDVNKVTTNASVSISFTNDNCSLRSYVCPRYVVLGQVSQLQFEFDDNEHDNVKLRVSSSQHFSSFVKYDAATTATVMLMPDAAQSVQSAPVELILVYTDSYHRLDTDWQPFSTLLYVFASEPPYFVDSLQPLHADR